MIQVTQTFLPPIEEYQAFLQKAWKNKWITNRGELALSLEAKLKKELNVAFLTLTTNGTLPLQIALKVLGKNGEIITTPFSYIATSSTIVWEQCTPVFVDIDPVFMTIDESKIEEAITPNTTAILATHVFGNPCHVEAIQKIALKHNLAVIYDAAHAYGVTYKGKSLLSFGDVSTCSFHATKIFHTGEGGAMICTDPKLHDRLFYSHNFGHNGPLEFHGLGINAKISELQAAMGLAVFPYMTEITTARKNVVEYYLQNLDNQSLGFMNIRPETNWNFSYFPVVFPSETHLLAVQKALNEHHIFPRRYFYPSLNTVPYLNGSAMPVSEQLSRTILCLPLYHGLTEPQLQQIVSIINAAT